MGVMDLPIVRDFWRKKTLFHVRFPATVMTRDYFLAISSNLHISDPMEDAENDKKEAQRNMSPQSATTLGHYEEQVLVYLAPLTAN